MQAEEVVVFMQYMNHHQLEVLVVQVLVVRVIMKMILCIPIGTLWSQLDPVEVEAVVAPQGVLLVDKDQVVL